MIALHPLQWKILYLPHKTTYKRLNRKQYEMAHKRNFFEKDSKIIGMLRVAGYNE
jgi:hypothetical protein